MNIYIHNLDGDVARIPAQLLSGIGFIGAGTILRDGFNVKGLTTAASLLTVTCIGLSIGAGFYLGGIISTLVIYFILAYSHKTLSKLEHLRTIQFNISAKKDNTILEEIQKLLDSNNLDIRKIKSIDTEDKKNLNILVVCRCKSNENTSSILSKIATIPNVLEVEED